MKWMIFILLAAYFALGLNSVMAQEQRKRQRVFVVDFQDEFVEGHVKNPTIFHLFNKRQLEYDELVDLKKDFLPELRRTAGEID